MKSISVHLVSPAYSPAQAGPYREGSPAEPGVPRLAQADQDSGSRMQEAHSGREDPPRPASTYHPNYQMQTLTTPPLYDSGSRAEESVSRKTKGISLI